MAMLLTVFAALSTGMVDSSARHVGTVSKAKRARKAGILLFNGQPQVPTITRAAPDDVLAYCSPEQHTQTTSTHVNNSEAQNWLKVCRTQGLRIVYECDNVAVVVKPVGIHVKGRGKRTVERALLLLLQKQNLEIDDFVLPVPHAVHRLDYRVGGLLLVAKTRQMEVELSAQFERHFVMKQYRAILVGRVNKDKNLHMDAGTGTTNLQPIVLPKALQEIRDELQLLDSPIDGKPCLTAMRIVNTTRSARYDWITTVDLWVLTGRKHQLRIHTARSGHPIVGDDLYHDAQNVVKEDEKGKFIAEDGEHQQEVVRGMGLFLFSVGVAFDDTNGNRRNFRIAEPNKFARFRHFCGLNWSRQAARQSNVG
ncbi:hypothetical protein BBO99_00000992 [Phytophthora kernoviae]|uniref:Pseudouridine synthase RsuA/RluA-like domain-containing protein n=2 Tax=Phytophthora kernoviae TaxID=325452 RepID=A0A3R7HDI3_9STRA|nr:hypothetical protein G195_003046 [Phytophthora kernoviae 00238/432]KAG2529916.1 hypothetical protein JM16_001750 [Phytophthora kernoviae]KAG2531779.1 hypothetical protein JM18_000982 [Phytophthora kernoviae]RLN46511.1 hypothetical protein BBI17_000893 [Phytophthora kernoviae]RLN84837.1 hypothetical protein BBO99_00000992 [Phytophthora kernoviae]